jgi:uncharacterized membrane protein
MKIPHYFLFAFTILFAITQRYYTRKIESDESGKYYKQYRIVNKIFVVIGFLVLICVVAYKLDWM